MAFLDNIKRKNQYPIIFIGSGITQRYFDNSPTWLGLLKEIWLELFDEESFYAKMFELKKEYKSDFDVYTHLADFLEIKIDEAFWHNKISISDLTLKDAYERKISPFKELIATKFKNLSQREGFDDEIKEFSKMLSKARIIVTTNYDLFIEECLKSVNTGIKVNVGNKGLFSKSSDYGELYKIHGSINEVNTISITTKDYSDNIEKSSIINAKILSNLVEAPILFLGYSLTDDNIRKLLTDFAKNSPYDIEEASKKIGVIEYVPGQEEIIDVISSLPDLSVHYTQIKTDNYLEVYRAVSQIDQGFLPSEISKFERAFRKIIEVKGEDKELKTVLTTYLDLSSLADRDIKEKNIVVAFGDGYYIYKFPDINTYMKEYFKEKSDMPLEIVLGFIGQQPVNSYFPFRKYLEQLSKYIEHNEGTQRADKLAKHLEKERSFIYQSKKEELLKKISKVHISRFEECQTINELMLLESIPKQQKITYISSHLERYNSDSILEFILDLLESTENLTSDIRKLLKMYDCYLR